jgi:hypothetical protein
MLTTTLFTDNFETGTLTTAKWSALNGDVMSKSEAGGPIAPTGIYALNLNAYYSWVGNVQRTVETVPIDLSTFASITLSYRVQAEGNGDNPDLRPQLRGGRRARFVRLQCLRHGKLYDFDRSGR